MTTEEGVASEGRRAEALRARRTELDGHRRLLTGGHRDEVRAVLELARLAAADELTAGLERMRAPFDDRIGRLGARGLARIPDELTAELAVLGRRLDDTVDEHAAAPLRRIAASRCPGAAPLPVPGPEQAGSVVLVGASPTAPTGALLGAALAGDPRTVGLLAGPPVLAAGGFGPSTALLTAGVVLLLGCAVRARLLAVRRSRLRAHLARATAAAGTAGEREVRRRVIHLERSVGVRLDVAVRSRLVRIEAELAEVSGAPR